MLVPSGVLFVGATELIEGLEETLNRRELAGKAYYERFGS
jgi:chemotaxis methyl-accepting protein methylase